MIPGCREREAKGTGVKDDGIAVLCADDVKLALQLIDENATICINVREDGRFLCICEHKQKCCCRSIQSMHILL